MLRVTSVRAWVLDSKIIICGKRVMINNKILTF